MYLIPNYPTILYSDLKYPNPILNYPTLPNVFLPYPTIHSRLAVVTKTSEVH